MLTEKYNISLNDKLHDNTKLIASYLSLYLQFMMFYDFRDLGSNYLK